MEYQKERLLFQGKFGKISKIKVNEIYLILKEFPKQEYFTTEVSALQNLKHDNIILVKEYGELKDCRYMIMEYASNGDLSDLLSKKGTLSEKETKEIFLPVMSALEYCHSKGYAHRDIKPENILLMADMTPKLTDFGFATTSEKSTEILGTKTYMAPEIKMGEYNPKLADFWSLGATIFVTMTSLDFDIVRDKIISSEKTINKYHVLFNSFYQVIKNLLKVDPIMRWNVKECYQYLTK